MRKWFDAGIARRNLCLVTCVALATFVIYGIITGDWEKWGVSIAYSSMLMFVLFYVWDIVRKRKRDMHEHE